MKYFLFIIIIYFIHYNHIFLSFIIINFIHYNRFHRDSSHAEFLPRDSSHGIPPTRIPPTRDSSPMGFLPNGIPPPWDSSHTGFLLQDSSHRIPPKRNSSHTEFLPLNSSHTEILPPEYRVDKCIYFDTLLEQLTS